MFKIIGKIVGKVCVIALCAIVSLALLVIGGLNVAKFVIYSEYYSIRTNVCKNPGLSDGFVCQGICAYEQEGKFLVSGYMKDHSASRIYVTDKKNDSYYVCVTYDGGKEFTGHAGGMAISGDYAYVASDDNLYAISVSSLLNAQNGDSVEAEKVIPVNNQASFVYADDEYIYVGEFHDGNAYVTDHPYETPDGMQYAIVSRYAAADVALYDNATAPAPDKVYSIRNKVQGICFTPDGKVVLSTSYGLTDTVYYVYNEADAVNSGKTFDGAPVYYLNDCVQQISGPAMGEDLDYYDGKIITMSESASNKYLFGKFFFADKIVALEFK